MLLVVRALRVVPGKAAGRVRIGEYGRGLRLPHPA